MPAASHTPRDATHTPAGSSIGGGLRATVINPKPLKKPGPTAKPDDATLLKRAVTVSYRFSVGLLGSSSTDGGRVYLDYTLSGIKLDVLTTDGKKAKLDPRKYLTIHEKVEWYLEKVCGWSYTKAHRYATKLEHAALRADGYDPGSYEKALVPYLVNAGRRRPGSPLHHEAPDMEAKPYEHPHSVLQRKLLAQADAAGAKD